ncbi:Hypothetical predicted protein [Marmota monax]|uniref:Uncharacterized protein n=1 Tax=Marmota monax TaxID=9995 RepID=A0A5E4CQP6_MARMO|nr:hypothetical protein GHT09_009712 [Marmota monax]VTJ84107.1 Hypothetical predicted protein [Marmota monax]
MAGPPPGSCFLVNSALENPDFLMPQVTTSHFLMGGTRASPEPTCSAPRCGSVQTPEALGRAGPLTTPTVRLSRGLTTSQSSSLSQRRPMCFPLPGLLCLGKELTLLVTEYLVSQERDLVHSAHISRPSCPSERGFPGLLSSAVDTGQVGATVQSGLGCPPPPVLWSRVSPGGRGHLVARALHPEA